MPDGGGNALSGLQMRFAVLTQDITMQQPGTFDDLNSPPFIAELCCERYVRA